MLFQVLSRDAREDHLTFFLLALKEYNLNIESVSYSGRQKRMKSWTSVLVAASTDASLCCAEP